jgi:hypothetical protein
MMWDEENLYVAMQSPLRKGERPIQRHRDPEGDVDAIWDDGYEIWFDVGARMPGGLEVYTQYLGNFAGGSYTAAYLPSVGLRRLSYAPDWKPANQLVERDGRRAWEMEVVIPRASIYLDAPLADGTTFRACLARNYKRPWEQNSIESGGFQKPAEYARFTLAKDAPALHLLAVADPVNATLGLRLGAYAGAARRLAWRFESDSGVRRSGTLDVPANTWVEATPGLDLDTLHEGATWPPGQFFRVHVRDEETEATLLDWSSQRAIGQGKAGPAILDDAFPDDDGDQVSLSVVLNPIRDYVRVTGDFINFDARGDIDRFAVAIVNAAGHELTRETMRLDSLGYVRGALTLDAPPPGEYRARLTALDAGGEIVLAREEAFARKDHAAEFDWWNTPHGNIERVLAPWTPVACDGNRVRVWGREMTLGAAGLPARIASSGQELLAAPCRVQARLADGTAPVAAERERKLVSEAEHRVVTESAAALGNLELRTLTTTEFDGMHLVEMTVSPEAPVELEALRVVIPLRNDVADHLHAAGAGIRWGYDSRFLPRDAEGRLWDSRAVDGQPMAVGSFIPYVWIGNPRGGLCWFADSDRGWAPNDNVPALEVRRDDALSTDLVLNLVSAPLRLSEPRTVTFAFMATPVKPLFPGWRVDTWNTSDTFMDYQCAESVGSSRMLSPVPWTFDVEKCRKMVQERQSATHAWVWGISKYRQWAVPYGRHNELFPRHMPEATYFKEHWQSRGNWHLYYDKTLNDYMCHKLAQWIESCHIDGYYSDNTRPEACSNVEAGRGYYLPDGRIQPAFNMFGVRRHFLRLRAVFAEHGKHDKIVTHMTHNMIIPWLGACDIAFDGEDHVIGPLSRRTFMDWWTMERMRIDNPHQWGVVVKFMSKFEHERTWPDPDAYARRHRGYVGQVLLHDALPFDRLSFAARDRFGIGAEDVRFLGFWDPDNGVHCEGTDLYASGWLRPGKLMLILVNRARGRQKATAEIDWKSLGLPPPERWYVYDPEHIATYSRFEPGHEDAAAVHEMGVASIGITRDGKVSSDLNGQDYRLLIVTAEQER